MTEEEFDELRPSAFAIAYRMLGSVSEAEDVVQEGFLRLHRAREGGERIESPRAYLSTVVSRLSLDQLRSARVRRESYVGEWLPEPLVASTVQDPARKAEMADSLSLAFLVLLESLSPEQRAAFLLHEAFDEPCSNGNAMPRSVARRARRSTRQRALARWAGAQLAHGGGSPADRHRDLLRSAVREHGKRVDAAKTVVSGAPAPRAFRTEPGRAGVARSLRGPRAGG
jgi:RNA polymerase sigma factor (sigma-70 family)